NALTANQSAIALKVNIADTASMLSPYAKQAATQNALTANQSAIALKVNIADTAAMLSPYAKQSSTQAALLLKENTANKSTTTTLGTSDVLFPTQNAVKTYVDTKVSGSLPALTSGSLLFSNGTTVAENNSNLFWDNTNKRLGILVNSPDATFQIGPKDNMEAESLRWGRMADGFNTLQLGYRQTGWKLKAGNNSGVITDLAFARTDGSTETQIMSLSTGAVSISGNLNVQNTITGAQANLTDLNVNSGAISYNSTNNKIGLFNANPTSNFQIGANETSLKYDYDGQATSALSLAFRSQAMRLNLLTNSGVIYGLAFEHNNGSTINSLLNISTTGEITASNRVNASGFVKSGGTSAEYLMADGSVSTGGGVGRGNGTGTGNIAIGTTALNSTTTGNNNIAVGDGALYYNTTNSNTTAIGWHALHAEAGSGNIGIGYEAGARGPISSSLTNSTFLGNSANAGGGTIDNATAIGYGAYVTSSNTIQLGNTGVTAVNTSGAVNAGGTITGNAIVKAGGTAAQYLMADGSVSTGVVVREVADEFSATAGQISFTLSQTKSVNSKVKMYVNGIRISNTAYSVSGTTLTYIPGSNGAYSLLVGDRIQFDYYY
ncbi:hypothetical protein, partial [Pedobacter frigoris]|uniref:hypothetical protein n=1 Tax=Pedobacter frigoris TaxID=2571272 RepID=UPI0029315A8F